MFWLIYVTLTIHNVLRWLEEGMKTSVPLVNAFVSDALYCRV